MGLEVGVGVQGFGSVGKAALLRGSPEVLQAVAGCGVLVL